MSQICRTRSPTWSHLSSKNSCGLRSSTISCGVQQRHRDRRMLSWCDDWPGISLHAPLMAVSQPAPHETYLYLGPPRINVTNGHCLLARRLAVRSSPPTSSYSFAMACMKEGTWLFESNARCRAATLRDGVMIAIDNALWNVNCSCPLNKRVRRSGLRGISPSTVQTSQTLRGFVAYDIRLSHG